jgi:hypothetical protein
VVVFIDFTCFFGVLRSSSCFVSSRQRQTQKQAEQARPRLLGIIFQAAAAVARRLDLSLPCPNSLSSFQFVLYPNTSAILLKASCYSSDSILDFYNVSSRQRQRWQLHDCCIARRELLW